MATMHTERIDPARPQTPAPHSSDHTGHDAVHRASLPTLLRELRDEVMTLARQEYELARAELGEKARDAQRVLAASLTGVAITLAGIVTLCIAASAGLYAALRLAEVDPIVAGWVAPLGVGALVTIIGLAMMSRAKKLTDAEHWRPRRTERSVRETKAWAERKV